MRELVNEIHTVHPMLPQYATRAIRKAGASAR